MMGFFSSGVASFWVKFSTREEAGTPPAASWEGEEPWMSLENQSGFSQQGFRDRAQQHLSHPSGNSQSTSSKSLINSIYSLFPTFLGKKIAQSWSSLNLGSWYPALPVLGGGFFAVWEGVVLFKLFLFLHQHWIYFKNKLKKILVSHDRLFNQHRAG